MIGKVIFFSAPKGWGFISQGENKPDLFVHYSSLKMEGYKKLEQGQTVQFDVEVGKSSGREQACNVVVVD
jgi:CspA family cold shock protein